MTYVERDIDAVITDALDEMPVVVITGMRRSGKTTFLQNHDGFQHRRYITFDDFAHLEAAKADPDALIDTGEPITIDEAQKCPEILIAIKRHVDKRGQPGRFLLYGSANFSLLKGISESLAGRSIYFILHPMSLREIREDISNEPFLVRFFKSRKIPGNHEAMAITDQDILTEGCLLHVWGKGRLWMDTTSVPLSAAPGSGVSVMLRCAVPYERRWFYGRFVVI